MEWGFCCWEEEEEEEKEKEETFRTLIKID